MSKPKLTVQGLLSDLSLLSDRDSRFEYLIELSERYQPVPDRVAVRPYPKDRLVPGCESEVYIFAEKNPDGTMKLHFAVENPQGISARVMAVLLDECLSGATALDASTFTDDLVPQIFGSGISMGKGQGLMNMVRATKALLQSA